MLDKETKAIARHALKKVLNCMNTVRVLPGWNECQEDDLTIAYALIDDLKEELDSEGSTHSEGEADAPE